MARRVAGEVVERRVQPGQRDPVAAEAVAQHVVAVRVRRDQQPVHAREPPVPVGPPEKDAHVRQLNLHVAFLDPIGAFVEDRVALSKLDRAATRKLRVVQVVVVPARPESPRHAGCRASEI